MRDLSETPTFRIDMQVRNNKILRRAQEIFGEDVTQSELARRAGASPTEIGELVNMKTAPASRPKRLRRDALRVLGHEEFVWRAAAVRLALCLGCTPEDLFPPETWMPKKTKQSIEITTEQALAICSGHQADRLDAGDVRKALATIPSRLAHVLTMRYGLDGHGEWSLDAIAEDMGVSRVRVHQMESKALRTLRTYRRDMLAP